MPQQQLCARDNIYVSVYKYKLHRDIHKLEREINKAQVPQRAEQVSCQLLESSFVYYKDDSYKQGKLQNNSRELLASIPLLNCERVIKEKALHFINLISTNTPSQSISWAGTEPEAAGA